jgi:hypothetical protein
MNIFRRFRQRRARRVMEKHQKLQQSKQSQSSSTTRPIDTIFRSIESTTTFQNIPPVRTAGSSFGGDDDYNVEEENRAPPSTSPTQSISCTSFAKGILIDTDVDNTSKSDIQKQDHLVEGTTKLQVLKQMVSVTVDPTPVNIPSKRHHKRSSSCTTHSATGGNSSAKSHLRNILDEIQSEIFVSDQMKEELLIAQIQLAFLKESYVDLQTELRQNDTTVQRHQLELLMGRKVLAFTQQELSHTKTAFQESVSALVEMKLLVLSLQEQLNQHRGELRLPSE